MIDGDNILFEFCFDFSCDFLSLHEFFIVLILLIRSD